MTNTNNNIKISEQKTEVENQDNENKKANPVLLIFSFLFPVIGIILFIILNDKKPHAAKKYGLYAISSLALSLILTVVMSIGSAALLRTVGHEDYAYQKTGYSVNFYDE